MHPRNSTGSIEAAIANYETAFLMQSAVPELLDLSGESARTQRDYGMEAEFANTKVFAKQCLLARRLVERARQTPTHVPPSRRCGTDFGTSGPLSAPGSTDYKPS
jgi:hypothetical protein